MSLDFSQLNQKYRANEQDCLAVLCDFIAWGPQDKAIIEARARKLVTEIRGRRLKRGGINAFMAEYDLSNQEGLALMCLAEALLRVPDALTMDRLIRDKLQKGNWNKHLGESESLFVNAGTMGLVVAGKLLPKEAYNSRALKSALHEFFARNTEKTIRHIVRYAMRILGNYFVMGEKIYDAQTRAMKSEARGYR